MASVGYTTVAGSSTSKPINNTWVSLSTATETFIARQGKSYASIAQPTNTSKMVIYSDTGSGPGVLLALSNELVGLLVGWNTYVFPSPITIEIGTNYYIGVISGTTTYTIVYNATGGTSYALNGTPTYAAGPLNSWVGGTTNGWKITAYVESIGNESPYGTELSRTLIAEIGVNSEGNEITRYISNREYISNSTDTPSNTSYLPIIIGNINTVEQLSIDGTPSFSIADIVIANPNGVYDSWLTDIWANRSIKLYIGDNNLPRSTFVLVFDGIITDIASPERNKLNFIISDKMQRLNSPLTDTMLGGTSANKEELRPVCYGECFNVTPLLEDDPLHKYRVNYGQMERFIETRDNGVVITPTTSTSTGQLTLTARPAGTVTTSIQGLHYAGAYIKDIANIIKAIVVTWGSTNTRLTLADIDITLFTSFTTANPQTVGYYCNNKVNVIDVITELASSLGAQVLFNRRGKLQIFQINLTGTPTRIIEHTQMIANSFKWISRPTVRGTIHLGYCRNWTVQETLDTGIVTTSRELFQKDMFTVTVSDSTVKTNYKQSALPERISTLLVNTTEATAEANRRLTLWKIQRNIYEFEGITELFDLTVGQLITLKFPRFGLTNGVTAQILSINMNWKTLRPTIQVLV